MRIHKNQFSRKIREIRGNRSYAKMADCLASEFKVSARKLYDLEISKNEPSLKLILALKEIEGVSPDVLLFNSNVAVVDAFNECHKVVARDASKLDAFTDKCWALAEAAREELYGYDVLNFEEPEEVERSYAYRLKEVREYYAMTADEVGSRIGYDRSAVYRNEVATEGKVPKARYIFNFCNGMNVSADYILFGEFLGLRKHSATILYGLPYGVQLALLAQFIEISKGFIC